MSPATEHATVLLIGASRGLGHAIAAEYIERGVAGRGHRPRSGRTPLHDLAETAGGPLEIEHVDINAPEQVELRLRDRLAGRTFDLLFVNAGVTHRPEETTADVSDRGIHPPDGHQRAQPDAGHRDARRAAWTRTARSRSCLPGRAAWRTTSAAASRSTGRASPRSTS